MRIRPKGLSIRYYISALLIALAALGLFLAWTIYRQASEPDLPPPPKAEAPEGGEGLGDLERLFQEQPDNRERYQVIAEKNLFSESRRAATEEAAPRTGARRAPSDREQEAQLLGTSIMGGRRSAMIRFMRFQGQDKVRIVEEGQTVRDEAGDDGEPGAGASYTVQAIERGRVTLTDQAGQSFEIGLAEPNLESGQDDGQDDGQAGERQSGRDGRTSGERMSDMLRQALPKGGESMQGLASDQQRTGEGNGEGRGGNGRESPPAPTRDADNLTSSTWTLIK